MEIQGPSLNNPAYDEMARYAVRLAHPVFWADPATAGDARVCRSGSGCVVHLGDRTVGITCQHVIARYRELRAAGEAAAFQFGPIRLDPDQYLLAESSALDLATLDMTPFYDIPGGMSAATCIHPARWPPGDLVDSDVLAFAGFPGVWREQLDEGYLRFYSFSSGASSVESISPDRFFTRLALESCVAAVAQGLVVGSIRGLSGGPVFVWRTGTVAFAEFVGIASQYVEDWDVLRISRVNCIAPDGMIRGAACSGAVEQGDAADEARG
jgi:hypothetical protein